MRWVAGMTLGALLVAARPVAAQQWAPGTSIDLVRRAAAQRSSRDADSAFTNWHARAHGIVRFTSLTGDAPNQIERVLRADELRVDVFGAWPGRTKQVIVAWRDTSFLPNTMRYHRDHLGIVANDFGGTIRIGDGDEVRDLIHPLSVPGLEHYRFAIGDTIVIATARDRVRVVAVSVRPADANAAGVVGTLYLDVDRAALVRFRFTFTPASYRDATVADLTVTLENSLREGARWLPWRQSIAIRRGSPLLELPWQTVIRGDWEIDDYAQDALPPFDRFTGAPIDGLRRPAPGATWDGPLAGLLTTMPANDADIERAQRDARLALGRSLDGLPGLRFFGRGLGDFLRINRVEGVTPGFGLRLALGAAVTARGQAGIGLSDHRVVGQVELTRAYRQGTITLSAGRVIQDVGDVPVISSMVNSLATVFAGRDHGDYTLIEHAGVRLATTLSGGNLTLEAGREWSRSVAAAFVALDGTMRPNPALGVGAATVGRLAFWHRNAAGDGWAVGVDGGRAGSSWGRATIGGQGTLPIGHDALVFQADLGAGTADLPAYRSFVLGGWGSLVGVPDRSIGGRRSARAELAWAMPVSIGMPPLANPLRLRLPSALSLVAGAAIAGGPMPGLPWQASGRIEAAAGLRLDLWGRLVRLESGFALRTGRVAFTVDLHPDWWRYF